MTSRATVSSPSKALDNQTRKIKEHSEKNGKEMTHSEAQRQAQEIAERANRKKQRK